MDVGVKNPHSVAATAHAGNHRIGFRCVATQQRQHFRHLGQAFFPDHALEISHHHGVGVWASHGADDVEGVIHIGHPVTHGFVQCVFQGTAAAFHGHDGRAQQFHAVDVGALAFHIFTAHVHHTFQTVARADGSCCHPMLASTGFGNDARLAHSFGEHGLAYGVVDFVGTRVIQVFAFQEDLRPTLLTAHTGGVVDRGRATDKVLQLVLKFCQKGRVMLVFGVGVFEFVDGVRQRFRHKAAAIDAEMTAGVGLLVVKHDEILFKDYLKAI